MFRIAICDSNQADATELATLVTQLAADAGVPAPVDVYRSARLLYDALSTHRYRLILLETEIGGVNGIDLARRIRFHDEDTDFIFVTGKEDYALAAYSVFPIGYILKKVTRKKLYEPLYRALKREKLLPSILLHTPTGGEVTVRCSDILFAEVYQSDLVVHGKEKPVHCSGALSAVCEDLPEGDFYRAHRNYVVNLRYVTEIGRYFFVMSNGEKVPVAKNRYTEARRIFERYCANR